MTTGSAPIAADLISAYVDGELDAATQAQIARAAREDRNLAARIAAEYRLRDQLRGHFAPVLDEIVPTQWAEAIRADGMAPPARGPADVIDMAAARQRRANAAAVSRWRVIAGSRWIGGAIAASLLVGMVISARFIGGGAVFGPADSPIVLRGGALIATGALAATLDRQLASVQNAAPTHILGTFRQADGHICRVFAGTAATGIACHANGTWQLQHVMPGEAAPATAAAGGAAASAQYRQAGSSHGALMAMAQSMSAGDPFDAAQEAAAKDHGWE